MSEPFFQHDADLLLGGETPPPADLLTLVPRLYSDILGFCCWAHDACGRPASLRKFCFVRGFLCRAASPLVICSVRARTFLQPCNGQSCEFRCVQRSASGKDEPARRIAPACISNGSLRRTELAALISCDSAEQIVRKNALNKLSNMPSLSISRDFSVECLFLFASGSACDEWTTRRFSNLGGDCELFCGVG
jgi:hypothetical protein